jgi:hypothetical protein
MERASVVLGCSFLILMLAVLVYMVGYTLWFGEWWQKALDLGLIGLFIFMWVRSFGVRVI